MSKRELIFTKMSRSVENFHRPGHMALFNDEPAAEIGSVPQPGLAEPADYPLLKNHISGNQILGPFNIVKRDLIE